jgi:phosphohistidine swiveling domain-containing protein
MDLIVGLEKINASDGERVGGKAVALAALQRSGHPIPRTWCLTTEAYDLFVERASLRAVVHQELGRKSFSDMRWEEIWDVALRIRNRFSRASVPDEILAAVNTRLTDKLRDTALAVRSSAPGEDSANASFAGLHESFVGIRGVDATVEAIRGVWASLWSDRALLYRRELGMDVDTSSMAVVIQELVEGTVSGIAFGIHPTEPELAVVESVYGLNQGLVDGSIEPDRWILDRASGKATSHTAPESRRRLVARGAQTEIEQVPPELAASPPLDPKNLSQVFDATRTLESLFGAPQDVEWTIANGRLVLLQSRPVTTSQAAEGDNRAWYLSLTRSLENLRGLRHRVEYELLPAMDKEAEELAMGDLGQLDAGKLADEIENRKVIHDRWVDVYWREFIPLAHGIRMFGQFYNDVVRPSDPYEFMELLAATPMLSIRRNAELARLASAVRDDAQMRSRLERGEPVSEEFERDLEEFQREYGGTVFADRPCFGDRARVAHLILAMANTTAAEPASVVDIEHRTEAFINRVKGDQKELARELLDIARVSYQLRDDDNIHLARLEGLLLAAVEEGRRRVGDRQDKVAEAIDVEGVVRALRHPNRVVEPVSAYKAQTVEPGFRARPRQLVGQPAGPGVATATARVIDDVDDLFEFQAGEVLVCDAVDPNMTFVVPMASAVVERRGGMLIHGAIIAREYGLPCVTGVPDITVMVATGDRLTVDGYLGIVTVAAPNEPYPTIGSSRNNS